MTYYAIEPAAKKVRAVFESGKLYRAYITGEALFPLRFALKVPKERDIRADFGGIAKAGARMAKTFPCEHKTFQFTAIGAQRLPTAVVFETREALLAYLNETETFGRFVETYTSIIREFEPLGALFELKPLLVTEHEEAWEPLLAICRFFRAHPRPGCYIREMGIEGVDTKFVERYKKLLDAMLVHLLDPADYDAEVTSLSNSGFEKKYGLRYEQPLVRFRLLDGRCRPCGMDDMSVPLDTFASLDPACENVLVVENKISMLSLPPMVDTVAVFGVGYGVRNLKKIPWLQKRSLFYWGDIDTHGLAILSQFRHYYPQTQSVMMHIETLERYRRLCARETRAIVRKLEHLTDKEQLLYDALLQDRYGENVRLEQERIPFDYVLGELEKALRSVSSPSRLA